MTKFYGTRSTKPNANGTPDERVITGTRSTVQTGQPLDLGQTEPYLDSGNIPGIINAQGEPPRTIVAPNSY